MTRMNEDAQTASGAANFKQYNAEKQDRQEVLINVNGKNATNDAHRTSGTLKERAVVRIEKRKS